MAVPVEGISRWGKVDPDSVKLYQQHKQLAKENPSGILPDGGRIDSHRAYIPAPKVLEQRLKDLLWLQHIGFDSHFIASVLQYDSPPIKIVRRLVARRLTDPDWLWLMGHSRRTRLSDILEDVCQDVYVLCEGLLERTEYGG